MQNDRQKYEFYLFCAQIVFNKGYLPENILSRDGQIRRLMANIIQVVSGGEIVNSLLMGPAGTGKTSCVLRVFHQLKEDGVSVLTAVVNCQENRTKYSVIADIYQQLTGIKPAPSGNPIDRVIHGICTAILDSGRSLVVFLDDVHFETGAYLASFSAAHRNPFREG